MRLLFEALGILLNSISIQLKFDTCATAHISPNNVRRNVTICPLLQFVVLQNHLSPDYDDDNAAEDDNNADDNNILAIKDTLSILLYCWRYPHNSFFLQVQNATNPALPTHQDICGACTKWYSFLTAAGLIHLLIIHLQLLYRNSSYPLLMIFIVHGGQSFIGYMYRIRSLTRQRL